MFLRQIWCWLSCCFCFSHSLSFSDVNQLDPWLLRFFHQSLTLMCVWLSFQTAEQWFSNFLSLRGTKKIKKIRGTLTTKQSCFQKINAMVCLFSGTNKDWKEVPSLPNTPAFSRQLQEVSRFLLLISVKAENPYSQSNEYANGKIILMALTPIIE